MESGTDRLWVTEAVGGRVMTVTPNGEIELIANLSEGHLVPTGPALDGEVGAYVGFETTQPYPDGASKVVHVTSDGAVTDVWTGQTAVTDVVMALDGTLYAAELSTNNLDEAPYLRSNSGRIVRQTGPDSLEAVVTDIPYPVFMAFDQSGMLYFDYPAFTLGSIEEQGSLVVVNVAGETPISMAGMEMPAPTCVTGGGTPAPPVATPIA